MNSRNIGNLIKFYRKRSNFSQLDLELKIECSQGSVSRIENGEVNPTKETLIRIVEALGLKGYEAAELFGIETDSFINIIKISQELNDSLDLDSILQKSVDTICYELKFAGAALILVDGDKAWAQTITHSYLAQLCLKVLDSPFKSRYFSLVEPTYRKNLMVRTILDKQNYISHKMSDFAYPSVSMKIANLLEKISTFKSGIAMPIIYNNQAIGSILFVKDYKDDFHNEISVLMAFTNHIATAIHNAQKYQELQNEIEKLKQLPSQ
jgi:transcriptional regulator with XRE-family HTH domain